MPLSTSLLLSRPAQQPTQRLAGRPAGRATLAASAAALLFACSNPPADTADMSEPDLRRQPGDLAPARCELPFDQRAIDKVSTGAVSITESMGIYTAQIDASAGGFNNFQSNPFVYVDLIGQKRVDITDLQARDSKDWDVAFKRYVIKVNSGVSGPGGVTAASVPDKALEAVTAAPTAGYQADAYFDANCMVRLDAIGGLDTAMADWYTYDQNTAKVNAQKITYVLKRRDGKGSIKLQMMTYYDGGTSGHLLLRYGLLP